jgi:hypothetical protein
MKFWSSVISIFFFGFLIGWWKFAVVLQSACSSCCYPGFCLSPWNSRCWCYADVAAAVKFRFHWRLKYFRLMCLSIYVAYDWSNLILIYHFMSHVVAHVGESSWTFSFYLLWLLVMILPLSPWYLNYSY